MANCSTRLARPEILILIPILIPTYHQELVVFHTVVASSNMVLFWFLNQPFIFFAFLGLEIMRHTNFSELLKG